MSFEVCKTTAGRVPRGWWAIVLPILFGFAYSLPLDAHTPTGPKIVQAMAELRIADPRVMGWNENPGWHALFERTKAGKEYGVSGVAVDFWHSMIQPKGRDSEDWRYHDLKVTIIADAKAKVSAELSTHVCGVNVNDPVYIPAASHIEAEIPANSRHKDLAYVSETGARSEGLVSIWGLKYVIEDYKAFYRRFRDHYATRASVFEDIIVSAGSAGELRLPSYDQHDRQNGFEGEANHPGRGLMQISSELAQDSLREAMVKKYGTIEALNEAWELPEGQRYPSWNDFKALTTKQDNQVRPANGPAFVQMGVDSFLKDHRQYHLMGQDIFGWQHRCLLEAGKLLLEAAIEVFHEKGSAFIGKPIGIKIPGVHWDFLHRFPQLSAGLISTEGSNPSNALSISQRQPKAWTEEQGHGYERLFSDVLVPLRAQYPHSEVFPIFTCAEKPDCHDSCVHGHSPDAACVCLQNGGFVRSRSKASSLMKGWIHLARKFKFAISMENALPIDKDDRASHERMKNNIVGSMYVTKVTVLRQSNVAASDLAKEMIREISSATAESAGQIESAQEAAKVGKAEPTGSCADQLEAEALPAAH